MKSLPSNSAPSLSNGCSHRPYARPLTTFTGVVLLGLLAGCSSDGPSEYEQREAAAVDQLVEVLEEGGYQVESVVDVVTRFQQWCENDQRGDFAIEEADLVEGLPELCDDPYLQDVDPESL